MHLMAWSSLTVAVSFCFVISDVFAQEAAQTEPQSGNIQIIRNPRETVLVISGIEPFDKNERLVSREGLDGQMKQALEKLRRLAIGAGALPGQIVTITIFTAQTSNAEELKKIPRALFQDWSPLVSVEARQLRQPGALVELEAVAIVRDAKAR
jgi:enamine deaminase RidA (YjgF/YER057c/UK114 family)